MTYKQRMYLFLFCLVMLHLSLAFGEETGEVTPSTFVGLQPERAGLCQMQRSAVPCERYKLGEKYYLLLYAHVQNEITLVKIVELAKDGSLRVQKTRWAHEILFI
jgi:hypothetical protein